MRKIVQFVTHPWRWPLVALVALLTLSQHATCAAEPKIVIEVEKRGEAFIVNALADVPVPLEVAWDVFVDIDHMATFLENITFSKVLSRNGNIWVARQDGVAGFGLFSFDFVSEREIRLEPMKHIVTRNLSGTLKRMQSEATFVQVDQGVRIKYYAEIVPDSFLAGIFGQPFVRREVSDRLRSMSKEMLRRHASTTTAGSGAAQPQ